MTEQEKIIDLLDVNVKPTIVDIGEICYQSFPCQHYVSWSDSKREMMYGHLIWKEIKEYQNSDNLLYKNHFSNYEQHLQRIGQTS